MSELGHWAVVFEDGSCATSGISVQGRLQEALDDADDSEVIFKKEGSCLDTITFISSRRRMDSDTREWICGS
jgi:hypothetical protein